MATKRPTLPGLSQSQREIMEIVWHRRASEVVGGYRLGPTDAILPAKGRGGLYTSADFSAVLAENFHYGRASLASLPARDRIAGTVIGGVAGGLLGSTIGRGSGRTAATVVGAAGGAYAGNQVQKNMQRKEVITTTERRCKTVNETTQKLVGYDVTYRLGDKQGTLRTSFKPGTTLPVKDGQVVVPTADAS